MNDYAAFIPVVNRFDLLCDTVNSASEVRDELTIIDNSENGLVEDPTFRLSVRPELPLKILRALVPLSFTQSMNLEFNETIKRGKKFCVHMHSDSVIPEGAIASLLEYARKIELEGRKWSVIYTHYDVLCIYNPECYKTIGGFDTNFSAYFSDNDWYRRCDIAGWERINTGIEVGHVGSQTINSDEKLKFLNGITFPLYSYYYQQCWGGEPGHEKFNTKFNRPDLFGKGEIG